MLCVSFWRSGHEPDQRSGEEDEALIKWVGGFVHPGVDVPWLYVGQCDGGAVTAYEDDVSATVEAIGEGFGNSFADSGGRACDEDGGDV